ncbi:MAG: transcription termination/antitermination protein NusG [Ginsengibacter sp.]
MQKNWYIIYTKPKWEKKVASSLRKKKIDNFLPLHCVEKKSFRRLIKEEIPVFPSYLFVKIEANKLVQLKSVLGLINIVYWKGIPASLENYEVLKLKDFINDYESISVEKTKISTEDTKILDGSIYSISGSVLSVVHTTTKLNLPSIGFRLVAKVRDHNSFKTNSVFGGKELLNHT